MFVFCFVFFCDYFNCWKCCLCIFCSGDMHGVKCLGSMRASPSAAAKWTADKTWWPTLFASGCVELRQKEKTDVALQHHQSKPQLMEVHLSMCYFLFILYFPVTGEAHMEQSSAGLRFTFIAVGGLVMLSTRRSMNEHRVRAPLCFLWCCLDCFYQLLVSVVLLSAVCSVMVFNEELYF